MTVTDSAQILTASSQKALDEFIALPDSEYLEVWKALAPPAFAEMDGEFAPMFPNFNEVFEEIVVKRLFDENSGNGCWLGKAYTPLGSVTGEGYNIWRMPDGSVERRIRFGTHMGSSKVDAKPALMMTYASFNREVSWENDMTDEIRKLADGVFLGVGTARATSLIGENPTMNVPVYQSYGLELKDHYDLTERTPANCAMFILLGPVGPYVGVDDPAAEDR